MTHRTRNLICIWIIAVGLCNFVAYTIAYSFIGGDAVNGQITDEGYYVRGHFIHGPEGQVARVSRRVWIYSYLHSISIWPTIAAVLLSMLVLARPHIIATMKEGLVSGQTLITIFSTVLVLVVGAMTAWFVMDFIRSLSHARGP